MIGRKLAFSTFTGDRCLAGRSRGRCSPDAVFMSCAQKVLRPMEYFNIVQSEENENLKLHHHGVAYAFIELNRTHTYSYLCVLWPGNELIDSHRRALKQAI